MVLGRILLVGLLLLLQLLWPLVPLVHLTRLGHQFPHLPVSARQFCRHVADADGRQKSLCRQTRAVVGVCKADSIWIRSASFLAKRKRVFDSLVSALEVVQPCDCIRKSEDVKREAWVAKARVGGQR